jgi:hypothetical protein
VFQHRSPQPGHVTGSPVQKPYTKCMLSCSSLIRGILSNTSVQQIFRPHKTNKQMSPTPTLISIKITVCYNTTKLDRGHSSLKSIMVSHRSVVYMTLLFLQSLEHAPKILLTLTEESPKCPTMHMTTSRMNSFFQPNPKDWNIPQNISHPLSSLALRN